MHLKMKSVSEPRGQSNVEAKSVGIWIRVSTEDQAKGESPEHHERRARMYAAVKGWQVREVYHLEAVSGKSVMSLPETGRMLEHIRSGHITALIFSKLARLARNTRELLEFADIFRDHEANLISLSEAIDTSTPAGRLFFTVVAAMAQWEREEIADRVAASVPIRAKLGRPLGGAAPFGYRWENRELIPDPKETPVRKLMYELFLEHKRKKTVARLLNEKGYRTRSGSKFSDTTVDRLLRDPIAKGIRRANYTKSLGAKKHWKEKPRNEWVLTAVEPIITEETWNAANAILEERRRNRKPRSRKPVHLFAGLVFCGCGQKMYVLTKTTKYGCQKCHNKIPVEDLECVFAEQLKGFVFSPEEVAAHLGQADEEIKAKEDTLRALETERDRVVREMDRIYKAYIADEFSVQGFGRQYRPLEERLNQIEVELPQLQGEIDFYTIQYLSRDEILSEARDLYSRWPSLASDDKKQIVEHIVERIVIGKGDIEIHLSYLPSSPLFSELVTKEQRNSRDSSRRLTRIVREIVQRGRREPR
ncbi:MAG: recombinase family protein [Candidatus Eisenbacteria bacterium]|uniref:Recombinase family protein n=1 Tax=Eiseniibacteriota bacterium TaxID=2212470 RepID=A0A948RS67_UNCEI|nr:recombinase family protein [Candidatus Eisenbacteria bacterium]MBU1949918.1 recombinase family protein [Candidatus Eisenbacteria bacterium]MBU2690005.1 recombinase family protein [Candidatus Eisenbacteria bacterium]